MLKSLLPKLLCPVCSSQSDSLTLEVFNEGDDDHVQDGVIICGRCKAWYPIEDELLEFIPLSLMYADDVQKFYERFKTKLSELNISYVELSDKPDEYEVQLKQREHYDDWAEDDKLSYDDFEMLPFWIANDQAVYNRWKKLQKNDTGWLLDVGAGNGRSAVRLTSQEITVIGIDISKKMLTKAVRRSKESGVHATRSFMVGDATSLSFVNESFDYAITSGVLSQLPNVNKTCSEIQRVLRSGGIYFGLENNNSMFRGIFDLLAKMIGIWKNETGSEPVISHKMLEDWHSAHKTKINSLSSIFLPPNLYNFGGPKLAYKLLKFTDAIFYAFGLKNHGGLIIFDIEKLNDE